MQFLRTSKGVVFFHPAEEDRSAGISGDENDTWLPCLRSTTTPKLLWRGLVVQWVSGGPESPG